MASPQFRPSSRPDPVCCLQCRTCGRCPPFKGRATRCPCARWHCPGVLTSQSAFLPEESSCSVFWGPGSCIRGRGKSPGLGAWVRVVGLPFTVSLGLPTPDRVVLARSKAAGLASMGRRQRLASPTQVCPSKAGMNLDPLGARGWEGRVRAGRGGCRDWPQVWRRPVAHPRESPRTDPQSGAPPTPVGTLLWFACAHSVPGTCKNPPWQNL